MEGGFDQNCLSLRRMVCSGLVLVWQLAWKGMVRKNMVRIWRACEDVFDIFRNSAVAGFFQWSVVVVVVEFGESGGMHRCGSKAS